LTDSYGAPDADQITLDLDLGDANPENVIVYL